MFERLVDDKYQKQFIDKAMRFKGRKEREVIKEFGPARWVVERKHIQMGIIQFPPLMGCPEPLREVTNRVLIYWDHQVIVYFFIDHKNTVEDVFCAECD